MALAQVNFLSNALKRKVTFNAILPSDALSPYDQQERTGPWKTLYLLHGIFGDFTDWVHNTRIRLLAESRNLAVIMPSGDNGFYLDHAGRGDLYGEFIGRELVQATRAMFRLSDRREDTFIAGLSMGGYGAIRNGLHYHETFSHVAGLSSALITYHFENPDNLKHMLYLGDRYYEETFGDLEKVKGSDRDPEALVRRVLDKGAEMPNLYLCCGTEDFLLAQNRRFRDFLDAQGVAFTYVEGPGAHDWAFWDAYIEKVLDWLPLDR